MMTKDLSEYFFKIIGEVRKTLGFVGLSEVHIKLKDEKLYEEVKNDDEKIAWLHDCISSVNSLLAKERFGRLEREWHILRNKTLRIKGKAIDSETIELLRDLEAFKEKLDKFLEAIEVFLNSNKGREALIGLERSVKEIFFNAEIPISSNEIFNLPLREGVSVEKNRVILVYNA